MLIVKRDGESQPIEAELRGEKIKLYPGGRPELLHPKVDIVKSGNKLSITLAARSISEAKNILIGVARKYPQLNVDEAMGHVQSKTQFVNDLANIKLTHGGPETFRAISKIAYLFFKLRRPDIQLTLEKDIVSFIKEGGKYSGVYYFYPGTYIFARSVEQAVHSIAIKSYPSEGILVAFVELFGVFNFAVLLSEKFTVDVEETYAYDLINSQEIKPQFEFPKITAEQLKTIFTGMPSAAEAVKERYAVFLRQALRRQHERYRAELIEKAMEKSLAKYPEGTVITEEMLSEFVSAVMAELTPYLANMLNQKRNRQG
jgi:hypothetical protein